MNDIFATRGDRYKQALPPRPHSLPALGWSQSNTKNLWPSQFVFVLLAFTQLTQLAKRALPLERGSSTAGAKMVKSATSSGKKTPTKQRKLPQTTRLESLRRHEKVRE